MRDYFAVMMPKVTVNVIDVAAVETADVASATIEAAPYVEFYQRMMTVTGKRSTYPSWIAHE
jgi:hypothetical protein